MIASLYTIRGWGILGCGKRKRGTGGAHGCASHAPAALPYGGGTMAQQVADGVEAVAETTVIPDDDEAVTLPSEPDVDPDAAHPYQDWGGVCIVCSKTESDPRHQVGHDE